MMIMMVILRMTMRVMIKKTISPPLLDALDFALLEVASKMMMLLM